MRQSVISHNRTVHKGMVDKVEPWYVAEDASAFLQNLDISHPGARTRRQGTTSLFAQAGAPGGVFRSRDNVFNEVLLGAYGGKLYMATSGSFVIERATGVSLTDAYHMGSEGFWRTRIATYVNQAQQHDSGSSLASKVVVWNDINEFSQAASMAPYCATWWQRRLWCAGNVLAENDETIWWSGLNDGLSYSLTNTIQVEPGLGGRITALLPLRGNEPQLLVFKERAICVFLPRWSSSSSFIPAAADALDTVNSDLRVISQNVGCVATRSVQYVPGTAFGDIIFLARDGFRGIRRTDQDVIAGVTPPISDQIEKTIKRINISYAHKAASAVVGRFYHCAVPLDGATANTHVLSLNLIDGAWFLNTWAARDLAVSVLNQTQEAMWMQYNDSTTDCGPTGAQTGYHVFKTFDGGLDPNGDPVRFQEDTRGFMPTGDIQSKQDWEWVGLTVRNEAGVSCGLTILYNIDQSGWVTAGSLTFEAASNSIVLGDDALPWVPDQARLVTKYLSLADAPRGFELQIRYVSEDSASIPTILDIAVKAAPIGPEIDNTLA